MFSTVQAIFTLTPRAGATARPRGRSYISHIVSNHMLSSPEEMSREKASEGRAP